MKPYQFLALLPISVCAIHGARAADAMPPSNQIVPSPAAAEVIIDLTLSEQTLRLGPVDVFPHAAAAEAYDDNVVISHVDRIHDLVLSFTPGVMLAVGDVSSSFSGPVSLDQLRNLLYYSLADEESKPRRFLGLDYTPAFNFYASHSEFNNIDHPVRLSGGYNFSRATIALDFDFLHAQVKDIGIGNLETINDFDTRLRTRYDFTEITSLEVNAQYLVFDYIDPLYQGYQDFRNENWLNRQFGDKLSAGLGLGFGYLHPQYDPDQTYEQGLLRAVYRLTGKSYLSASAGLELRQFGSSAPDALRPIFSVTGVFQPLVNTTITLEGHRREDPAPFTGENFTQLGASVGVRQLLFNRCYAGLSVGYDNIEYTETAVDNARVRTDNYFYVSLNFDYEFNTHWTATAFYSFRTDDTTETDLSYYNNVFGARITWKY